MLRFTRPNETQEDKELHVNGSGCCGALVDVCQEGAELLDSEVWQHDGDGLVPGVAAEDGAEQRTERGQHHLVTGNRTIPTPRSGVNILLYL